MTFFPSDSNRLDDPLIDSFFLKSDSPVFVFARRFGFALDFSLAEVIARVGKFATLSNIFHRPRVISATRDLEWCESRSCLLALLERDPGFSQNKIATSLSHTDAASVAVMAQFPQEKNAFIGIDLERADRPLSERLQKRMIMDSERSFGFLPIEYWALKEAALKASRGPRLITHFQVQTRVDFPDRSAGVIAHRYRPEEAFDFEIIRWKDWVLACTKTRSL